MSKYNTLKNEIQNSEYFYQKLLLKIISQNKILINSISETKIKINAPSLIENNFLSANEQFLMLLYNLIFRLKKDFECFTSEKNDFIIEQLIKDNPHNKYLLCKHYIGNNRFISYFNNNYYTLVVYNFYKNLKKLSNYSKIIENFSNSLNLKFNQNEIKQNNILLKLYNSLIFITNNKVLENDILLLFKDIDDCEHNSKYNKKYISYFYLTHYETMIINCYKKNDL